MDLDTTRDLLQTLLNFTKTSPVNLTSQVQLLVDMLAMNEHNNEAIEGIIVLPRLDAITKPLGFFTWDPRSIVRDLLPFAKDVKFFDNVHILRISNNAHDSLAMDPVHMDIGLASIRVSSHAKRSIRNVLISSNIMLSNMWYSESASTRHDSVALHRRGYGMRWTVEHVPMVLRMVAQLGPGTTVGAPVEP